MSTQATTVVVDEEDLDTALTVYGEPAIQLGEWVVSDVDLLHAWYRLREEWLDMPKGKNRTNSIATRRAYAKATNEWLTYLAANNTRPWLVSTYHVRGWLAWLQASGMAVASVNQKLAAVSSWYSFVINEKHLANGVEVSIFMDRNGNTRANPFRTGNVLRPPVDPYDKAHPLNSVELNQLFTYLQEHAFTVSGSRNYALILSHFLTGTRSSELCRLTWGDIRPSRTQPGSYVFKWEGKGGKKEPTSLPARAYHAIEAHLRIAGRFLPGHEDDIQDDEFIFKPLMTGQLKNFKTLRHDDVADYGKEHLTSRSVQRCFQKSLKAAGIKNWKEYRVHDLRHSFALLHYEATKDLKALRALLHHSSISTTDIYIRHLQDPRDTHSEILWQQLGF